VFIAQARPKAKEEVMADKELKTLDYNAVLADLEARKAALDHAIASLKVVMASGVLIGTFTDSMPPASDSISTSLGVHGGEVPVGAFLGKSIPEAAKLCLQILKRKMTTREIAEALKKGGIESSAKNFPIIVHSILDRASKGGSGILRLDRAWGLAEWYPAGLRSGAAPDKRVKIKKARKTNRSKTKQNPAGNGEAKAESSPDGLQERIAKLLRSKPGVELAPSEIAASLGVRVQTIHFLLGKLAYRKQAEKTTEGKYKAIAA
jgi:hypothetical protein